MLLSELNPGQDFAFPYDRTNVYTVLYINRKSGSRFVRTPGGNEIWMSGRKEVVPPL